MMHDIFKHAELTLIWLGRLDEVDEPGFELLLQIYERLRNLTGDMCGGL